MSPAIRISLGIVALTVSLLLVADSVFSIFPDPDAPKLEARRQLCESLAVQYSALVSDEQYTAMENAMGGTVSQVPEVLSIGLRTVDGQVISMTSEHPLQWLPLNPEGSTPTHVRVPIFQADKRWGTLEIAFAPLHGGGLGAILANPLYKLILIVVGGGFLVYLFYLSRTLRYLDPSKVVPARVQAALDQLVEGALILDDHQCIVLANAAFAQKVDRSPDSLLGVDPSTLGWTLADGDELPWIAMKRDLARREDVRLELASPTLGVRVLSTNVSPIVDGNGKQRGALATFDDISEIETMNRELRQTVERLEVAQAEVRQKNQELFRLATLDALTGKLNRRALFEKLGSEFKLARDKGHELSLIMADIDHFKRVNDDFGHPVGDAMIKMMADVLAQACGDSGAVGRYGGEEFCVVLADTDTEGAARIADVARLAFAERSGADGSPTGGQQFTSSFGVSSMCFGAGDVAGLLDEADQALYQSKTGGRNRVTCWGAMDASGRKAS